MNLGQVQAALLRDLIQTDNVNPEALTNAVRYAHLQLQLSFNWRAMYHRVSGLVYPAGSTEGVLVESAPGRDDCKQIVEVFLERYSGDQLIGLETLWPATQESASRDRRIAQIAFGAQPSLATGWNQKWYDRARRVTLLIPPDSDAKLTVDFYRFLPFYPTSDTDPTVDPSKSDYFSKAMPHVLQAGAAYWLCKNILEDQRAETFYARFVDGARAAWENDRVARLGALAEAESPIRPQDQARIATQA